ncbi:single-stranded DNA-binding protein [Cellulomonas denverensis]|uniref:Single-stranded DNA-binding protein n=1 Tax=Cellulomonas denverensis TaxID=264297 RepID=A0A7X6QYJ0_9CELL|nr:single-stranded DNA-binding protein [Cellulomonas denverensis]NKY22194.1 single-stranded DNA-binding protein [Cellulomonas denverensis]GIG27157.1 single-stranded DNA-binding protein [Cellulomonas denverensis]
MTTITVTGNLGADAELRYTPSGSPVLNTRLGTTKRKRQGNEWIDDGPTDWYQLAIWGSMAEALAEAGVLKRGVRVTVTGELTHRPYDTPSGGRTSNDVRVHTIGWHDRRQQQTATQGEDPWATAQEPPAEVSA